MRNYAEWIATTPDPAESSDTSVTLSTLIRSHGSIRRNGDRATLRPSSRISPIAATVVRLRRPRLAAVESQVGGSGASRR